MPDEPDAAAEPPAPLTPLTPPPPLPPAMPTAGKRRAVHSPSESAVKLAPLPAPEPLPRLCDMRSSRRRRLVLYSIAFATMLGLSSVLDIRRAELRHRQPKVQLTLPSGSSLSSLADAAAAPRPPDAPPAPAAPAPDPNLSLRPFGGLSPSGDGAASTGSAAHPANRPAADPVAAPNGEPPKEDEASSPTLSSGSAPRRPSSAGEPDPGAAKPDPNLSEQELKDDVAQLIAHVDEEASHDNSTAPAVPAASADVGESAATPVDRGPANANPPTAPAGHPDPRLPSSIFDSLHPGPGAGEPAAASSSGAPANSSTGSGTEGEVRLNSEEHFSNAQKRMEVLLADEALKRYADENDLRVLQALALQATRGDCEHKSGTEGGSLFKTDAEAASNVDIERTDPLWGAWCLFMGSYKTDAMRDYVTKQHIVEDKMVKAKTKVEANSTSVTAPFDPSAASLDDVMTPEQQSALRQKTDTLMAHLREYDIRYLAALSLQATFGDCGPYGKETESQAEEGEDAVELRKLREPLLDQTVERREGAQWGAWCVLQGTYRAPAATELSNRVDLLIAQLSKSQAASQSGVVGAADAGSVEKASVRAVDSSYYDDDDHAGS